MEKRRSLIDEQLEENDLYNLYDKYVRDLSTYDWKVGACYIRVSTHEQDKFSPLSQLKEILEYALEHEIFIPKDFIFRDIGKSGMKDIQKRTDFLKLIDIAQNRPFEIVLLYKFSRFARSKEESVYYKAKLRKEYNIEVVSIKEALPKDNSRVLVESMYEGQDEYYVLNFKEETKRGKKEKLTRGEWLNAPPFGYKFDRNTQTLVIVEEKAEIVKFIYKSFIEMSERNIKKLVRKLNDMKIASPKGGLWSDLSVKRILRNPAYIGYIRYCEGGFKRNYDNENIQLFKGKHTPIIEESIFNEVQEKMKISNQQNIKYMKPASIHTHWLSGILKCGDCGRTLVRTAIRSRKPWFQCTGYTKAYCQVSHYIREDVAIPLILEQLKKDFSQKLNINITKTTEIFEDEILILKAEIEKLYSRLKRAKIAYQDGIDSLDEYRENKLKITQKIENTEKKIKAFIEKQKSNTDEEIIYKKSAEAYKILSNNKTPLEIKQEIARNLFEKIVYDKKNECLIIYYKL